ncbi:MAG: SBBP repeat-containing protein [Bacteroidota bacterium]|nr:SBBP repeat-containing protein [Bacteroidota bacterium]
MKSFFSKKQVIAVLAFIVIANHAHSQTQLVWGRQFGSNKEEYARNHVIDPGGNIYVSGNTTGVMNGKNIGKTDGFITKIDSLGNTKWSRQFGTDQDEDVQWSAADSKGNVYITGTTKGDLAHQNSGKDDVFVIKYSPDGQMVWTKQFGSDSTDIATGIFVDKKGYIYLSGMTLGKLGKSVSGKQDAFLMKLDNNGDWLYTTQFGTAAHDGCAAVTGDNKGNIYVVGTTFGDLGGSNKGFMDVFVGQFSDKGTPVKFIQFGSESFDIPTSILVDNDVNIYVGGSTSGNMACGQMGEGDCFLTKMNMKGQILWNNQFGTKKHDGIKGIAFNKDVSDNIVVSGLLNLPPAHAFIRMYRKDGSLLWERNLVPEESTNDASGKNVSIDNRGFIYHSGLTHSGLFAPVLGEDDFYLVKLKMDNSIR